MEIGKSAFEDRNSKSEKRKSKKPVILISQSREKNLCSCKVEKRLPRFFASLRMTDSKPSPSAEG